MADQNRNGQSGQAEPLYSLAHLTLVNCAPAELVNIAGRVGYDAVSLRLIKRGVAGEFRQDPLDRTQIQATKTALASTGLRVLDIEAANIREDSVARDFEPALEIGGELGARHMITAAWTKSQHDKNFIVDTYAETCDLAKTYGLTMDLEFPTFSRLRNLAEALDVVRTADRPNGGILVDILYLHLSRMNLDELLQVPPAWLHFLHISDCVPEIAETREEMIYLARSARLYPSEGCIDFAGIIERCPPLYYSIELPNQSRVDELGDEEHARRCLAHAKQTFGEARSKRGDFPTA